MKKLCLLTMMAALAAALPASALTLTAHCQSLGSGSTNLTFEVEPGQPAGFSFPCPGEVPVRLYPDRAPLNQTNRLSAVYVGLNHFDPNFAKDKDLKGCESDVRILERTLSEGKCWPVYDELILTNGCATKAAIRGAIAERAARLVPGEVFLYQHSSHGSSRPSIIAYDDHYSAQELASDLAAFKPGVKIVAIIDTCYSAAMIPEDPGNFAKATLEALKAARSARYGQSRDQAANGIVADVVFLTACQSTETSWENEIKNSIFEPSGLFTGSLVFGAETMADENGDSLITFLEAFHAACKYIQHNKNKQTPFCSNEKLAGELFLCSTFSYEGYGLLSCAGGICRYDIPALAQDVDVTLQTAPYSPEAGLVPSKLAISATVSPEGDEFQDLKCSVAFRTYNCLIGMDLGETLQINGVGLHLGRYCGGNKARTSLSFDILDADFKACGSTKIKIDKKKLLPSFQATFKSGTGKPAFFRPESGDQETFLVLRNPLADFSFQGVSKVKYNSKSRKLTAKLIKEKPAK